MHLNLQQLLLWTIIATNYQKSHQKIMYNVIWGRNRNKEGTRCSPENVQQVDWRENERQLQMGLSCSHAQSHATLSPQLQIHTCHNMTGSNPGHFIFLILFGNLGGNLRIHMDILCRTNFMVDHILCWTSSFALIPNWFLNFLIQEKTFSWIKSEISMIFQFQMSEAVKVAVRCRPMNQREQQQICRVRIAKFNAFNFICKKF